jgi:hypothetical protein
MKIKSIIKEELADMVRETAPEAPAATLVRDNRLKFASPINAMFNNFEAFTSDFDTGIDSTKITVFWNVNFLVNPEGIYKFNVEIEKVEGQYILKMYDKHTDELMQETPKNITDTKWQFQIEEVTLEQGGFLFARELEFDFKTNICTVVF